MFAKEEPMFRVKVCGITTRSDAEMVARAGADAIGLNFYPPSPRYVTADAAREIIDAVPAAVARVGVFVNSTHNEIVHTAKCVGLDWIQVHGDEPPEFLAELSELLAKKQSDSGTAPIRLLRAFRCRDDGLHLVGEYVARCRQLGCELPAILLDAYSAEAYGGTGHSVDWRAVARREEFVGAVPTILAGGLTPENVRQALEVSRATGVDVASGVESSSGIKSAAKVEEFVQQAKNSPGSE